MLSSFDPATEVSAGTRALQGAAEGLPFDLAYEADSPGERLRNVVLGVGIGGALGPVLGGRVRRADDVPAPDVSATADRGIRPFAAAPAPEPTTSFERAWEDAAAEPPRGDVVKAGATSRMDVSTRPPDAEPVGAGTAVAPADPLSARYRQEYASLSDDELDSRLQQLRRGAGRTQLDADVSWQRDAARRVDDSQNVYTGTRSSTAGMHARGRNTQQQARIRAVEAELRSRGREVPTDDPYLGAGRSDVLDPNKDLVGTRGRALQSMSDEDLEN